MEKSSKPASQKSQKSVDYDSGKPTSSLVATQDKTLDGTEQQSVSFIATIEALARICQYGVESTVKDFLFSLVGKGDKTLSKAEASQKLVEAFYTASDEDIRDLIQNRSELLVQILNKTKKTDRHKICDRIYTEMTEPEDLADLIGIRFGVPVGPENVAWYHQKKLDAFNGQNVPQDWTTNGLKHVYSVYMVLPQKDLDLVRCLLTYDTKQLCPGGAASGSARIYFVNYDDENPDALEGENPNGYYCESNDTRVGMNQLDTTIAHELGHIVDASVSKPYSERADFRAISGWQEHTKSDTNKLLSDIMGLMEEAIPNDFSDTERLLLLSAAKKLLKDGCHSKQDRVKVCTETVCSYYGLSDINADFQRRLSVELKEQKTAQDLGEERRSHLITPQFDLNQTDTSTNIGMQTYNKIYSSRLMQIMEFCSACSSPWYKGQSHFSDLKRRIHESYTWKTCWYSFDKSAWDNKISMYQFRDPGEEFAELYASYHCASKKGENTPEPLRNWFEANGLHIMDKSKKQSNTKSAHEGNKTNEK